MSAHKLEAASHTCPNLAPMVDVIMVLLVFFLLGASLNLVKEGALQTDLDASSGPAAGERYNPVESVKIGLDDLDEGKHVAIQLNDDPLKQDDFAGLEALLKRRARNGADTSNPLVITAHMKVRWHFVVRAMDAAVRAGFKNVQFGVSFGGT